MEPLNITNFEIKRDGANASEAPNKNGKEANASKNNRDIDMAIIKGLFEFAYNNLKTK